MKEFHVARSARDRYQFDQSLFSLSGNVIFANMHAVRLFTDKINRNRDLVNFPEQALRASQIYAMGLIDEIMHLVIQFYQEQINPAVMEKALEELVVAHGPREVRNTLHRFADQFPPLEVYNRRMDLDSYLEGETEGVSNQVILLEEMLVLWLANANPAFAPYLEFFADDDLEKTSAYRDLIRGLKAFFDNQPFFGPDNQALVDMLRSPAIQVPNSLAGQLEYIREKWGYLLGRYLMRLLSSLDLIREEEKFGFLGSGPSRVYDFTGLEKEVERFSPDKEWMPTVVLMAKNAYVWLDQLSKKYQSAISRLDQIPDEELDTLRRWGFNGLWLIGLWERSPASQRIKHLMGNPDAVASAYSLYDYQIAADLGGEVAYENLRQRAWARGIRLSSDMVPNHMGIDSRWVMEHPDWFIHLNYSPFPSYSFNGPNLSQDDRVGLYLEDHYYERSDAAVVFKRVDHHTGREQYIYHGNDGTSMPWNDTAQLDFLRPDVREAVIQTILHVARKFSIIRFDAAMTLARKHYQRLWFPEPGTGGAIPSRAEFGLTRAELNARMPVEFWREVVDRVAQEVPDTLLLAEAFWLMEGYFVRTLGMHRVYNSAFMNMLRDEENANYRSVMKNTLEFDPQILKRFVNFMNNPDERTAVDQFGKGDKYFGICTLMATLPGLPMFGHGQIQGFSEKYGMEFRRAYWHEEADPHLIARHEKEIFPVLHRRYLFAEVDHFLLYDLFTPEGFVNEDVYAFSNRSGSERSLVVYHNKYAETSGWIKTSVAFASKDGTGESQMVQKSLIDGLDLRKEPGWFTIFRDHIGGLEYLRNNQELADQGLFVELAAYKVRVFLDFRQVQDDEWGQYATLAAYLNGRGVPSIEEVRHELLLRPIHEPFRALVNPGMFRWLVELGQPGADAQTQNQALEEVEAKANNLFREAQRFASGSADISNLPATLVRQLGYLQELTARIDESEGDSEIGQSVQGFLTQGLEDQAVVWGTFLAWLFTHALGKTVNGKQDALISRSWLDEWLLAKQIARTLQELGYPEDRAWQSVTLIKFLVSQQAWTDRLDPASKRAYGLLEEMMREPEAREFLQINRYQGVLWIHKESFERILWWPMLVAAARLETDQGLDPVERKERLQTALAVIEKLAAAGERSGYRLEEMAASLKE